LSVVALLRSRKLLVVLAVAIVALVILVPSVSSRLEELQEPPTRSTAAPNSFAWRIDYWEESTRLVENPVTGIGLKMTAIEADQGKVPHSDPVRSYVEMGLLGLVAYVILVGALVLTARRSVRFATSATDRGVAVGFAGCVAVFCTISLAGNLISQVVVLWYFFAFAACAESITRSRALSPAGSRR
jgi:O-antigen ligase